MMDFTVCVHIWAGGEREQKSKTSRTLSYPLHPWDTRCANDDPLSPVACPPCERLQVLPPRAEALLPAVPDPSPQRERGSVILSAWPSQRMNVHKRGKGRLQESHRGIGLVHGEGMQKPQMPIKHGQE